MLLVFSQEWLTGARAASHTLVIIPLTEDETWLRTFENLPPMRIPDRHVLVVAPHPDDETLGIGALLATLRMRGVPVTVVAVTDGENAYDESADNRRALGIRREHEQHNALSALGVEEFNIRRLRMTDSGLSGNEQELADRLLELVTPDMILLAPWVGDFHPDHGACARAATIVAQAKGLPLISYFFWTWHQGGPELLDDLRMCRFDPAPEALAAKARALSMHGSQLEREGGEPVLPLRLLAPARWLFEVFLMP